MTFFSRLAVLILVSLEPMVFVAAHGQQASTARQTVTTVAKGKIVSVVTRQVRVVRKPALAVTKAQKYSSATRPQAASAKPARKSGTKRAHPDLLPGYPNAVISSQSFGSTVIGQNSATVNLSYPYPSGVTIQNLTFAAGLNGFFGQATCSYPQPCTAPIAFAPVYPGVTTNAVISKDQNGNVIYETLLYGTGTGPQFGWDLGDLTVHPAVTNQPGSIAVGPDGSFYLADPSQSTVYQIASDFSSQTQLNIDGLGAPGGIAVDGAGTVYIADKTNNVIVAYNALGGTATVVTSALSNPSGVAVNAAGLLFIADTGNGRIIAIDNQGGETTVVSGLSSPTSLAVDAAGDLFYVDAGNGGEITEVPVENSAISIATQLGTLYDMAVDAAGRLYISTPTGDTLISPGGAMVEYGGGTNYGMAVDPAGDVITTQPSASSVAVTNRSSSNFILATQLETTTTGGDTISNTGNSALTLGNIAISGTVFTDDPSDQCVAGLTLAPGSVCGTAVDFAPQAAQNYQESYTVTSNSLNVPTSTNVDMLLGTGIGVPTTTALAISPNPATTGQIVTFTATLTPPSNSSFPPPTGTVNFLDGTTVLGSGTISMATNMAQFSTGNLTAGTHSITAAYAGDIYNAASTSPAQNLLETAGNTSSTQLAVTPVSPVVGQTVTFVVGVAVTASAQPTGTVTLTNTAVTPATVLGTLTIDGNGQGSFSTNLLAAGSYSVTATYNGDVNYDPSTSGVVSFMVSPPVATNITLTASPATLAYEGVVTLSANVFVQDNVTSGQVVFCDATAASCNATLNLGTSQVTGRGTAVLRLGSGTIGTHRYTATYLGGNGYAQSTSAAQTVTVTGTYPTTTAISSTGSGGSYGLLGTVVGFGTNTVVPTGTVSFLDTSNANASLGSGALGAATAGFSLAQPSGSPAAVGEGAYGVATGDFNGDGFQDVVVGNYESDTVSVLLGNGDGTFQPQVTYSVGSEPERVLVADFNGDGILDLVVANTGSGTISILLGNGDGTFQAQVTYQCGSPVGLAVMDINHDGYADVVAGNYYDNSISVLLGNGDGTLQPAVTYATGSTPQALAEGDFNGDGNIDVAVGNEDGQTVGILLGNGDGTFQTMVTYPVGSLPQGVQVGDFNSDGKQDLAVTNQGDGTISVLLGNGDGTFQAQVTYPVGVQPVGLAIADFNGDGIEDITVGNTGQASLTQGVLLGNGDGTFQPQVTFPTGNFPYGVAVADFNGDGVPDMAVADFSDATATIFLGQVTETATATANVTATGSMDTEHDVEASYPGNTNFSASTSTTTPLFGNGTGSRASTTSLSSMPARPTVGQNVTFTVSVTPSMGFDSTPSGTVTLMNTAVTPAVVLGTITLDKTGAGTFSTSLLTQATYAVTGVYSGDSNFAASMSIADTFAVSPAQQAVSTTTSLNATPGTMAYEKPITLTASVLTADDVTVTLGQVVFCDVTGASTPTCTLSSSSIVGVAQLTANNNGAAILKLAPGTIGVHNFKATFVGTASNAASTSGARTVTVTGTYPTTTAIAATGLPGNYTLTSTIVGTGSIVAGPTGTVTFQSIADGTALGTATLGVSTLGLGFANLTTATTINYPGGRGAVGDFNGDGILDVAFANNAPYTTDKTNANTVTIELGNGDGTFTTVATHPATGTNPGGIVAGDFNGDGKLDLATVNYTSGTVTILLGNGDGTFTAAASPAAGTGPYGIVAGDFNGDGIEDLVVSTTNGALIVLLGNGDGTFTSSTLILNGYLGSMAVGDFNGNGKLDIAVQHPNPIAELEILMGNGDGTFTVGTPIAEGAGSNLNQVAAGDLNGDGKADLVVTNQQDNTVTVLLSNGDGTFQQISVASATGTDPEDVQIADFNADGLADIAVSYSYGGQGGLQVLPGNGDGTFTKPPVLSNNTVYGGIAVGDLNGDGIPDIASSDGGSNLEIALTQITQTSTATVSNIAPAGSSTVSVEASYPGDATFSASMSQPVFLTGAGQVASATTLAITPTAPTVGQSVTFSVVVAGTMQATPAPTGTVTLMNTAATPAVVLGTITLGTAGMGTFNTATLAAGTYSVVASYSGDTNYLASMSVADALVVGKETQTITFGALSSQTYGAAPIVLTATTSSGLPVTYSVTGPATVNGTTLTITGAGSVVVMASQVGNTTYAAATAVSQNFTVAQAVLTATGNNASRAFGAANPAFTYAVTGFVNRDTAAVVTGSATLSTTATATSNAGTYPIAFATQALTATNYSFNYVSGTLTITGNVAQTITFPAIPDHSVGDAAFTLSATASSGLVVSYAATGPATVAGSTVTLTGAGTVTIQATQAGNVDYAAATPVSQTFTVSGVSSPTASSILPAGVVAGSTSTTITLTGANFTTTDAVEVNGTALTTIFVSATTVTAMIPSSFFSVAGTLPISVVDTVTQQSSGVVNFTVAVAPVVVFTGPSTATSDQQPMVTFQLKQPYAVPINCLLTLTFVPATTTGIDDQAVQFSTGGRTISFTVPAGSTTTPAVQFQTGTVAGTVTVTLGIVADDVDVTPSNVAPIVVVLPEVVPQVATATLSRTGAGTASTVNVTMTGFSNTRDVTSAIFHFTPTPGNTISDPDVTIDVTGVFATWFSDGASDAYGSSFTYTQPFNLNADPSTVQSVTVTLVNGVGNSVAQTTE